MESYIFDILSCQIKYVTVHSWGENTSHYTTEVISLQSKKTTKNEHKQVCVEDDIKLTVHLNYKDSLISDGQQFHKRQQNKQSPLTLHANKHK
jgi:hypothetical protein